MNSAFLTAHSVLTDIYQQGAFSSIQLNKKLLFAKNADKALVTKIVYGVLEKDIYLDYVLSKFVKKSNKQVSLYLKMGAYCLLFLSIPQYAVVNDIVELSKMTGDVRLVGFVNATLKNVAKNVQTDDIELPDDKFQYLSVKYSYPLWAVKKLIKDYGEQQAEKIVSQQPFEMTTVRVNTDKISAHHFEQLLIDNNTQYIKTQLPYAFFVKGTLENIDDSLYTVQSLGSVYIALALGVTGTVKVLDCCSAPGGKAVFIKQYSPNSQVTACDVHEHRVCLIQSYASRMGVEIDTRTMDMSVTDQSMIEQYDYVLCDVPCSGFGVVDSRPDIKLFRQEQDISSLMKLQYAIVNNCWQYLKVGGTLVYSTCTVFFNENQQIVNKLLKANPQLQPQPIQLPIDCEANGKYSYQFLPDGKGMQGFFVAKLTRVSK